MLPECLIDSYKQYKSDTDRIVTWLVENAEACGFTPSSNRSILQHNASNVDPEMSKIRLKGRARKLARDAAAQEKKKLPQNYAVRMKDFVIMAKAITTCQRPRLMVPKTLTDIFRRTILARRRCAEWYAAGDLPDGIDAIDSKRRHDHFISVLEDTLDTLGPRLQQSEELNGKQAPSRRPRACKTKKPEAPMKNRFESLSVEDVEECEEAETLESANTASDTANTGPEVTPVTCTLEMDNDEEREEEFRFAAWCLIDDLNGVRKFLAGVWRRYKMKEIDLVVAAATTNMAVSLARKAESECIRSTKDKDSLESGVSRCIAIKQVLERRASSEDKIVRNSCAAEEREEWSFFRANVLLSYFSKIVPENSLTDETDSFREDLRRLQSIIPLAAIDHQSRYKHFRDEISYGFMMLLDDSLLVGQPLWLVFATQILLDMHRELQSDSLRALEEARLAFQEMRATFEDFFETHSKWHPSMQHDKAVEDMHTTMNAFEGFYNGAQNVEMKPYVNPQIKGKATMTLPAPENNGDYLSLNSFFCGLVRYHCFLRLQHYGLLWANNNRAIISTIHLYTALSAWNEDFPSWNDLEVVMLYHSKAMIAGAPKTVEDALKRWYLTLGYKAETFARGRRKHIMPSQVWDNFRQLGESSILADIFLRRCFLCECPASLTVNDIDAVLRSRSDANVRAQGQSTSKPRHQIAHRKPSTLQLLESLEAGLKAEMPELLFDYFSMDKRCTEFWFNLADAYKDREKACWTRKLQSGRLKGYEITATMVPEILRHACDLKKAPSLAIFKGCSCVNKAPLRLVGERMEEVVRSEGSVESDKVAAYQQCRVVLPLESS